MEVPFTLPLWMRSDDEDNVTIIVGGLYTFNAVASACDGQPLEISGSPFHLTILPNGTVDLIGDWSDDFIVRVDGFHLTWNGDNPPWPTKRLRFRGKLWYEPAFSDIPNFVGRVVSIDWYRSERESPRSVLSTNDPSINSEQSWAYCLMVELGVLTKQEALTGAYTH